MSSGTRSWDLLKAPGCCICLQDFTRPSCLPCGHSFCLQCIGEYWRISEAYLCPLCKASFPKRPQLQTEATAQAPHTPLQAGEVPCDVCPVRRPAVRSCLVCLTSYCCVHLEPHYQREELGRHLLVSVAKNLEESECRLHGRPLERFCRSDQTILCTLCVKTEHRGHRVISVSQEAARRKVKLKRRLVNLQREVEGHRRKAEEMKMSVHSCEQSSAQTKKIIERLEEETSELGRTIKQLEALSETEDNLEFLQGYIHSYS